MTDVLPTPALGPGAVITYIGLAVCGVIASVSAIEPQLDRAPSLRVLETSSVRPETNAALSALVADIRTRADAFVFLSGGASKMSDEHRQQLLAMFQALGAMAKTRRLAVGDGGTQAGIMEAAGQVRRAHGHSFLLVGVAPASAIPPRGKTPIDPNHSHLIAVLNPKAPAADAWGSETETMYWLFGKLAEGRPSVAIVANGGSITLDEVEANVRAGRRMIVIEGSGRAADALVSLVRGTPATDPEIISLRDRAEGVALARRPELIQIVPLRVGAAGLSQALALALDRSR